MEVETKKTGIVYVRVSSLEQVDGTSLESQERICRQYAEREGISVLGIFVERGESAKTADRTEFNKAILFCSNKKQRVNYFIVYKLDRFARNQDDHAIVRSALKKYRTELRSATEPINETPVGRLMEGVISSVAEFDNSIRSERSKGGMMEKIKKGHWVWRAPIGYKRLVKGGNLLIDEDKAYYVRLAFEEYSKGIYSFQSLAKFLGDRGFRTARGNKPIPQLMEKMIHNSLYCGIINVWNMRIEGDFAPIVSEELFLKCQSGPKSKFSSKKVQVNPEFPLRRFTICSECGNSLTGSSSTGRKGVKYPYYHHHKQNCSKAKFIPKDELEKKFLEFLENISPKKKYEKIFKSIVLDVWQSNYKKLDSENARIRRDIENLESERQKIFALHREGKYTEDEFLEQKGYVNTKIGQLKLLLDEKKIEEFNMEEALDHCFRFAGQSGKTWKELSGVPAYRMRFQKQIFPEKVTFDGEKFGTSKMSLIYEINQQGGADSSKVVTLWGFEPQFRP